MIVKVLLALGFDEAGIREKESQHLITTPRPGGDNPAGIMIYTNTLKVIGNTRSEYTGNLFTLVMKIRGASFPEALAFITDVLNINSEFVPVSRPFGGFYRSIQRTETSPLDIDLPTYSEEQLPSKLCLSKKFLDDNIALNVQEEWGVRYSIEDDAVLIPVWFGGNLVGCKARANGDVDFAHRWWAYLPYSKTQVVYGFDKNYHKVINKNKCIITESEKGVLQLQSIGINIGLAIAGHSFSRAQAALIKSLGASEIIVAFDQDVDEEEIRYEASKLQVDNGLMKNKVTYIYDKDGLYLPKGSKMSPSDGGKNLFLELYKNRSTL